MNNHGTMHREKSKSSQATEGWSSHGHGSQKHDDAFVVVVHVLDVVVHAHEPHPPNRYAITASDCFPRDPYDKSLLH